MSGLFFCPSYRHRQSIRLSPGCPQGSVFSPLLFNIYISKLNEAFSHNVKVIGFADDINFYSSSADLQELLSILKNILLSLKEWLGNLDMIISTSKTHFLLYPPNYSSITPRLTLLCDLMSMFYTIQTQLSIWAFKGF